MCCKENDERQAGRNLLMMMVMINKTKLCKFTVIHHMQICEKKQLKA